MSARRSRNLPAVAGSRTFRLLLERFSDSCELLLEVGIRTLNALDLLRALCVAMTHTDELIALRQDIEVPHALARDRQPARTGTSNSRSMAP
jgi:hypothetical protein